jgi:cyclopropane-fatty-acyl-phospholipid synthase
MEKSYQLDAPSTSSSQFITQILTAAGIEINGSQPWDIQIHDSRFYNRVFKDPDLGLGESYMEGWWDCPRIDELMTRLFRIKVEHPFKPTFRLLWDELKSRLFNFQNRSRAKEVALKHYNIGNDLYQGMLDSSMTYSCGYWKNAQTLDEAQRNKLDLVCRKLMLKPGLSVLDIGCGWGSFAKYAAENYNVQVVGITLSQPQKELAETKCRGLPITVELMDYRDLAPRIFDRVVSIGMFEHVGYKNYRNFMEIAHRHLSDDGLFLLHTIGGNISQTHGSAWINKYIFPNGMLPSITQIGASIEALFIMEDWHNFGPDYDKTLLAWHKNFNEHWPRLREKYGDRFQRMWNYYLLSCAALFRSRCAQLWQVVLTKKGLPSSFQVRE